MTKKTLLGLLLVGWGSLTAVAQTQQAAEQLRSLASATGTQATASPRSTAGSDVAAVKEINQKVALDRAIHSPQPATAATAVNAERNRRLDPPQGSYQPGTWQVTTKAPRRSAAKAKTLASSFSAAEYDTKSKDGTISVSGVVTIVRTSDTDAVVYNLWGLTDTLKATYNEEAGTLSITPGKIYDHSTYGAVWACSMNSAGTTYSVTNPIVATIGDDGTLTLAPWGVLVVEGQYKGGGFGIYSKSVLKPTNATISEVNYNGKSVTVTDSVRTYPVYVEQTYDNQVQIVNFTNNGATVSMRLKADKTATIVPQTIFTNAMYGAFKCRPADWAKTKTAQKGNIVSTAATDTQISFGNWGVFCDAATGTRSLGCLSSTIDFEKGVITFPTASSLDWSGEGTEASPYVITTAKQLNAFSDDVNAGNDYAGKYVALGADIDMSQSTSAYLPVGTADAPFRGTFDGKNYTVSNLNIKSGEENYQGLFGYADSTSVIKNVKLANPTLNVAGNYSAPLAGWSSGVITGITVTGATLTYANHTGAGVVGYYNGSDLSNCEFTGKITGVGENAGIVGEIAGSAKASNLKAHGSISVSSIANTVYKGVGGIAGATLPGKNLNPVISDSYSDMQLTTSSQYPYVGGIVGQIISATVERCFNAGVLSTTATTTTSAANGAAGGVAGSCYGGTINDCYNSNIVINSAVSDHVGGIVGYIPTPSYTSDSKGNVLYYSYESRLNRCLNFGQVRISTTVETMGAYGTTYSDTIFTDLYYDKQIAGTIAPANMESMAKTTAELTSGNALGAMSSSVWTFTAGLYPRLKSMADVNAAHLGAAPMTFAEGDNVTKVRRTFKISTANDIYWKLYTSSGFADSSTGLNIKGDSVTLNDTYSNEIIVAMSKADNSIMKMYSLATINPSLFSGSGSEADPYLIKSKTDLESLDQGITTYGQTFKGDFFKQVNDVDATGFGGIGMGGVTSRLFNGTYDGCGYAIHNLKIDGVVNDTTGAANSKQSLYAVGLFGIIGEQGTVKNITIANDCQIDGYTYVGGVAGMNYGALENCKNLSKVSAVGQYAGGVTGYNAASGTITNSYNAGHIVVGGFYAGGIAGYSGGSVTYCQNDGYILGDSINPARKAGVQATVAGIVGSNSLYSVLEGNVNSGAVKAARTVGGISTNVPTRGSVKCNINYGTVERTNTTDAARGAVLSAAPAAANDVTDNYYDSQIGYYGGAASSVVTGLNGVTTSVLTSGKALDNLDADRYDFTAGLYPVLKAFKDEAAAKANRKMVVIFGEGQTADDVFTDAALYSASDLQWSVATGKNFIVDGAKLRLNLTDDTTSLRDELVAKVGDYEKTISLRAMPKIFDGEGTAESPFEIKTKADMLKLAKFVNGENYQFTGRYFKQLNDIDFDTTTYVVVGKSPATFNATFDGAGHQLSNINNTYDASETGQGLFGNVGVDGYVHDVTVASGTITGYRYLGAIAGNVYGRVENCVNKAAVYADNTGAAGIVGMVKTGGVVSNCKNYGAPSAKGNYVAGIAYKVEAGALLDSCTNYSDFSQAKSYLSGIATYSLGMISRCVNYGDIKAATGTSAGILAQSQGGDSIVDCVNYGAITATGNNVGGIIATGTKSTTPMVMTGCVNNGEISGKGYLGGVAGHLYAGNILYNCGNNGAVTSVSSTNIGGVVGQHDAVTDYISKLVGCYNTGNVIAAGKYAGGVVGNCSSASEYYQCYNLGNVLTSADFAGGFCGGLSGHAVECYNAGDVEGSGYGIGGFSGLGSGTAEKCFNLGNVTSTNGTNKYGVAGGLWGYGRPTIRNCYNMGIVSGQKYVGGIAGGMFSGIVLENVYNAGSVVTADTTLSGLIAPASTTTDLTFTNVYYDTDFNNGFTPSSTDAYAKGVTTRDLTLLDIDTVWNKQKGMYPTLNWASELPIANYFAAVPVLAEGETYDHIRSAFVVGTPDSTEWTMSEHLFLKDGQIDSNAEGSAWITKTYKDYTTTYKLYIERATGIDGIDSDAAIMKTEYFTVGGVALGSERPSQIGVYVVKDTYSNGKSAAHKLIVGTK